jgi:hypothetical protein
MRRSEEGGDGGSVVCGKSSDYGATGWKEREKGA